MNPNWLGTICSIGALVLFFLSYRLGLKVPERRRLPFAIASTILAIPGASFAAYYAHAMPEQIWYYEFRSWRGTECLVVMLGIAGGFIASVLPRMLLTLPLFGTAVFAIVPFIKPFVRPIPHNTLRDKWDAGVCLQSSPSTCGAASVATILDLYGVKVSESKLAADAHSYVGGTEAWYLARVVREQGCEPRFRISSGFDPEIPFPAIAGVSIDSIGHFIPILSRAGDQFQIGDPLVGRESLARKELVERYAFTGFYMSITNDKPHVAVKVGWRKEMARFLRVSTESSRSIRTVYITWRSAWTTRTVSTR